MRRLPVLFLLFFVCTASRSFAQNVDGHWFGVGIIQQTNQSSSYLAELIIRQKGKNVWGELLYYFKDSLIKAPIFGNFDKKTGRLNIKPISIIYYRSPNARNSIDCSMSGFFRLVASKTESVLQGSLVGDEDHKLTVPDINFRLKRSNDTANLVMKDEEPAPKPPSQPIIIKVQESPLVVTTLSPKPIDNTPVVKEAPVVLKPTPPAPATPENNKTTETFQKREKEITKVLEVNNTTLRIELYDNGEIDNDSVSVFFNNILVLPQSMLDLTPIKLTVQLDTTVEYNELSMFAVNLGNIPPNTALLVLYDGKTRYEIFLSSDLNRSATLRLRKKKP